MKADFSGAGLQGLAAWELLTLLLQFDFRLKPAA